MGNKTALGNILDKINDVPTITSQAIVNGKNNLSILELDTRHIINWEFHDRPETELGDLDALAKEFIQIGQQQPCVVREHKTKHGKYELIIGERRWRAAQRAALPLNVIVRDLSDNDAALAQAAENDNREDLSEYAKGISFSKLIEQGVVKQKELINKLGKSKQYISSLLSFSKIPHEIVDSIGNMSKISARTAEKIKQLCSKNPENINRIILLSDKIREGKIGWQRIEEQINKTTESGKRTNDVIEKIYSPNGRHIFTWRQDNNKLPSIHFPKNISDLMQNGKINHKSLTTKIIGLLENELELLKKSAAAD